MPREPRLSAIPGTVVVVGSAALAQGIAAYPGRGRNWEVLLCRPEDLDFVFDQPQGLGLIGAILSDTPPARVRALNASGTDIVLLDQPPQADMPTLSSDGIRAGEMAFRAFRSRGFRRFGFWGLPGQWASSQRQQGFESAITRAGLELIPGSRPGLASLNAIMKATTLWLKEAPKPLAIFTDHASRAMEILWASRLARIRIPEQVAIIGGTDDMRCTLSHPTVSGVDCGEHEFGLQAAGVLDDLIRCRAARSRSLVLPPKRLLERRSSDSLADVPPHVLAALDLITRHVADGIGVRDIVVGVKIPRRTLELAFRTSLDRSIGDALVHARMMIARSLLEKTRLSVTEICRRCGLTYPAQLSLCFKRQVGMTIRTYRHLYGLETKQGAAHHY